MSLLCQLWSLHESIQEYKGSCQDLSAGHGIENGYFDEDDEYYQETSTTPTDQPEGSEATSPKNGTSKDSWLQDSFHIIWVTQELSCLLLSLTLHVWGNMLFIKSCAMHWVLLAYSPFSADFFSYKYIQKLIIYYKCFFPYYYGHLVFYDWVVCTSKLLVIFTMFTGLKSQTLGQSW